MRKYFITFGDTRKYQAALARIEGEVVASGFFDGYRICDENSIPELIAEHQEFFARSRKGFGYWIWKSHIVRRQLDTMGDGDILLYADSGCQLNVNEASIGRLQEYFDMLADSGHATLSFELGHKERRWTKRDCFDFLQADIDERFQLVGGVFLIKKGRAGLELIDSVNDLVSRKLYHLFDDTPSVAPNDPEFIEHRHDQSVLSLLRKAAGTLILPDETWFEDWQDGRDYPILARRIRG
jgi:hypothetical protein